MHRRDTSASLSANAAAAVAVTVATHGSRIDERLVNRSIDGRRQLTPCEYLADPWQFGRDPNAVFILPEGGDPTSQEIARILHLCFLAWRASPKPCSGAQIARQFGFSRQTWSAASLGQRWPGHTIVVAALASLRRTVPDSSDTVRER